MSMTLKSSLVLKSFINSLNDFFSLSINCLSTGSSRGLGYGIAKSLGKAGAKVVINYLNDRESGENALKTSGMKGFIPCLHALMYRILNKLNHSLKLKKSCL